MITLVATLLSFSFGALAGAILLAHWWIGSLKKPENARKVLKQFYRNAHPHWLQLSETDSTRVCPCCGWNETEGLMSDQKCEHPK